MRNEEYPVNREWKQKAFSMPKLPGGDDGLEKTLYTILQMVKEGQSPNTVPEIKGSDSTATLGRMCEWIRPIGLVNKEKQRWSLTELGETVLKKRDSFFSTAVLCSSIVFMGEILFSLNLPKTSQQLLKIAESYHLSWKTYSEIHNRIKWFRDVEMVYFEEYKLEYHLTEKGEEFLRQIDIVLPSDLEEEQDETIQEDALPMEEWARMLEAVPLEQKRMAIGYMPGKMMDACTTISTYLQLMNQAVSIEHIREYSQTNYQIAVSSSNMFLSFLEKIGFIDRVSRTMYMTSELGRKWMEKQSPVDLIACLNARYLFVYELLAELRKEPKNAKTLSIIAKVSYGFERESIDEIRKRLILLSSAKLVYYVDNDKYGVTARGEKLLDEFSVTVVNAVQKDEERKTESGAELQKDLCESVITELRLSSRDSANPDRFEKAIKSAFVYLGFQAAWLGGSGKTDVLIQARTAPKLSYVVAVDAKSTQSGNVTEEMIDFDTLKEHRKLHHADYSAIVGCSFRGERLFNRCREHKVALLDMDIMEQMIRNQAEIPLTGENYKKIFEQTGIVDLSVLDEARNQTERYGQLVDAIMGCLVSESQDEVTEGVLTSREIYRTVRDDERFSITPGLDEIEDILRFLESPLIGCVGKNKDGYYAVGSLNEVANKFQFYARNCKKINQSEEKTR